MNDRDALFGKPEAETVCQLECTSKGFVAGFPSDYQGGDAVYPAGHLSTRKCHL